MMKFIDNNGITDPRINLAIEEYALRELTGESELLLFYVNEPSIIIGKNQNTAEEINLPFVEQHGIHVVRRLSGGGAVYHDLGNLNFSFITNDDGKSFHNYKKFTEPVVRALRELGVEAELSGRNDIQVGERKISGNAQFATKGRMYSHGTLLFDTDLDRVNHALKVKAAKIEAKGVKSVRSRVANISEFLKEPMTIGEFRAHLLRSIFRGRNPIPEYKLTEEDWRNIEAIADNRYRKWEWNFGESPEASVVKMRRFEGVGNVELHLVLEHGKIESIRIFGDFFGTGDVAEMERAFTGLPLHRPELEKAANQIKVADYIGNLDRKDFVDLLLS
jgi:lipoate-protein ligase A